MNVLSLSISARLFACSQYMLNPLLDFHFDKKQRFIGYEMSQMLVAG